MFYILVIKHSFTVLLSICSNFVTFWDKWLQNVMLVEGYFSLLPKISLLFDKVLKHITTTFWVG